MFKVCKKSWVFREMLYPFCKSEFPLSGLASCVRFPNPFPFLVPFTGSGESVDSLGASICLTYPDPCIEGSCKKQCQMAAMRRNLNFQGQIWGKRQNSAPKKWVEQNPEAGLALSSVKWAGWIPPVEYLVSSFSKETNPCCHLCPNLFLVSLFFWFSEEKIFLSKNIKNEILMFKFFQIDLAEYHIGSFPPEFHCLSSTLMSSTWEAKRLIFFQSHSISLIFSSSPLYFFLFKEMRD